MRVSTVIALAGLIVLAGCSAPVEPSSPATVTPSPTAVEPSPTAVGPGPAACVLTPVVIPTPPAEIPGYTELDPSTGLHVTGKVPEIDFDTYRLQVTGKVDNPLSLTYDDLRCMPKIEERCTLTCPGFFVDEATWAGASLTHVLDLAGVQAEATGIKLKSADGYSTLVFMGSVRTDDNFLAYEWEGEPLPILHGFPVRAVFPALSGSSWAKWLIEIEVL